MMFSVSNEFHDLTHCVVGTTYGPEQYDWITESSIRHQFQDIATCTVEYLDSVTEVLQGLGVTVLRPRLPRVTGDRPMPVPPIEPRNVLAMVDSTLYAADCGWASFYARVKDAAWYNYASYREFMDQSPDWQHRELSDMHGMLTGTHEFLDFAYCYADILDHVQAQGNSIQYRSWMDGAQVYRFDDQLVIGTQHADDQSQPWLTEFQHKRIKVLPTQGHMDGVFVVLRPGLILAHDDPGCRIDYDIYFPGWEVIWLTDQNRIAHNASRKIMDDFFARTQGRWWLPDLQCSNADLDFINQHFDDWFGHSQETMFSVNLLMINDRDIIINNDHALAEVLARRGFNPMVLDLPYPYFWDGGIHCMTADLDRRPT